MYNLKSGSTSLLGIVFIFLFTSIILGQTTDKKHPHPIVHCDEDKCNFATYAYDDNQIPLLLLSHKQSFHNKEISLKEYQSLKRNTDYISNNSEVKRISCPFCDDFALWSDNFEELKLAINLHTKLVHKKELSESEIKTQIK
jgi:predicted small metal-binding protein